jgi:hypothetical protein
LAFPPACLPYVFLSFGFVHYIGCPPVFEANRDGQDGLSTARPIKAFRREADTGFRRAHSNLQV